MGERLMVKLKWITPDAEALIAYIARVSNPKNQDNPSYEQLIKYVIQHSHWSPFEMANAVFEIHTSRAITAQILRHWSFRFQEFSQRYAAVQSVEEYEPRRQDTKNRQASHDDLSDETKIWYKYRFRDLVSNVQQFYNECLEKGIAKECARFILPMSSSSCIYMNGTIRSWIHYINLRTQWDTQKEHRDIAEAIKSQLISELPTISKALGWA
jgi:thymidylate synthase (FAD)